MFLWASEFQVCAMCGNHSRFGMCKGCNMSFWNSTGGRAGVIQAYFNALNSRKPVAPAASNANTFHYRGNVSEVAQKPMPGGVGEPD